MARDKRRKLNRSPGADGLPLQAGEVGVPAYSGIGQSLRSERLRMGQDLYDVAEHLRIKYSQMLAIEEGRFGELPGHVYAVGFLRTYATHLGLDPEAVVQAFKEETAKLPFAARLVFPAPAPETRTPRGWLIVVALLVAAAIYGAWYYSHSKGRSLVELVSPVPSRLLESAPKPADPAAVSAPAPTTAQVSPTPPATAPAPPAGSAQPAAAPAASSQATSAAPTAGSPTNPAAPAAVAPTEAAPPPAAGLQAPLPPAADDRAVQVAALPSRSDGDSAAADAVKSPAASGSEPSVFGSTDAGVRVVLKAHADSWIDVRGANNEVLLPGRVLHQGDVYKAPDRPDVVLWTGNLGALEIVVDGKSLPRLGAFGESRRNISLDAKRLLAGTAIAR